MSSELEDFRQKILSHAKLVAGRAPKVETEAGTNTSLVQPFLTVLGYDIGNPDQVSPEHHADFYEKNQNRVDYAILHQGKPVIAIESKKVGGLSKENRGQLRGYFNACTTVKLGILTDGLKFEFYADSDKPNMMDEIAFLRFDFGEIAINGVVDDNILGGIAVLRNGSFNPEDVGAEAKRKLLSEAIVETIKAFKSEPTEEFIRFILGRPEVKGKIGNVTQKIVESNRDLVKAAMEAFVAQEALARFGYAPKDLVRAPTDRLDSVVVVPVQAVDLVADELNPSENEIAAFNYTQNRLFYLVKGDVLFAEVEKITYRKTKTSFRVYYGKPNNGSLFDYKLHRDGNAITQFPALGNTELRFNASPELDDHLLKAFTQRVAEAGITFESVPVLRAVNSGQVA